MKIFTKSEWFTIVGLIVLCFIPIFAGIFRLLELSSGKVILPNNPRVTAQPLPVILHILGAVIYCVLGIFQFLPSIRQQKPKWHRYNGRLIFVAGIISALTGLWMTHFYEFPHELQGEILYIVRMLLGSAMFVFLLLGLAAILKRNISKHYSWMIRAYAIGLGASTQALILLLFTLISGEPLGLTRDLLMTFAWIINIIMAEWIIKRKLRGRKATYIVAPRLPHWVGQPAVAESK